MKRQKHVKQDDNSTTFFICEGEGCGKNLTRAEATYGVYCTSCMSKMNIAHAPAPAPIHKADSLPEIKPKLGSVDLVMKMASSSYEWKTEKKEFDFTFEGDLYKVITYQTGSLMRTYIYDDKETPIFAPSDKLTRIEATETGQKIYQQLKHKNLVL